MSRSVAPDGRLPGFVIIGAAKAATTWIAAQLRAREDVFLPGPEPHYFSREYHRGPAWYRHWFEQAGSGLVGEKSADYLADPAVPARLARDLPDAKLIVLLRAPVERAYSDYCMWFRRGDVSADIDTYLDRARTPMPRFLDDGLYARHLTGFLEHVPRESLLVLLHDDVATRPAELMGSVEAFLGLPPAPAAPSEGRVNDSRAPLLPLALRRLPAPVKRALAPLRGNGVVQAMRNSIARPIAYPPLTDRLRARMADFYAADLAALEPLIGRDLGSWRAARAEAA